MDVFVVGSLVATVLVMIGALLEEFAQGMHKRPEVSLVAMSEYERTPTRELEQVPYDEAA